MGVLLIAIYVLVMFNILLFSAWCRKCGAISRRVVYFVIMIVLATSFFVGKNLDTILSW